MLRDIPEPDWRVLKRLHPLALERYCERVLAEIESIRHQSARGSHQRYRDIYALIQRRDRELGRIFDDLKRSNALTMLAQMRVEGLLTDEEFSRLSVESRSILETLCRRE